MSIRYYDKGGAPIELPDWCEKLEDQTYKRILETTMDDGTWISTVWLGLDHQHGDGQPLIFETMVFQSKEELDEQDIERYSTLDEAIRGHGQIVSKWEEIHA